MLYFPTMAKVDLSTELCGVRLQNPTVLASGILGTSKGMLKAVALTGAGAVTIKSLSLEPLPGHNNPIVIGFEAGMLNAVGYANPGIKEGVKEFSNLKEVGVPVIASIIGRDVGDFMKVLEGLRGLDFAAVEVSLSCPHTPGYGMLAGQNTPEATKEIVSVVRKGTGLPLLVKLSPNIPEIGRVARAAEEAGADGITAVNTLGPGMLINIEARQPILDFKVGGVSGPALRPIALRCVYDIYKTVKIPILGVGGISTGRHAIEMLMAGAYAVGIGTAVYSRGIEVFGKVCQEMEEWMEANECTSVKELIGSAHAP
ncbi:MAG TPA: dihydroorotate dehydrogenase [Candidatus Brocadiales bacterium]|nr:dihydroorotate dehydrogenase [Candidatus Brocadiales bacterium]